MLRFANVATPETAATDVVPESVPPPGLVPMATVTLPVKLGSVFPSASCALACTAGVCTGRDRHIADERGGGVPLGILGRDAYRRGDDGSRHGIGRLHGEDQ